MEPLDSSESRQAVAEAPASPGQPPRESAGAAAHGQPEHAGHMPVHARRGTGWWLLVFVLIFAAGLCAAFVVVTHRKAASEADLQSAARADADAPMTVDVVKVQSAPAIRMLTLPGETRAWYETTIYARVSGYLKKWNVDIGDSVKEGQELATIETPELDQQVLAAQAKVEAEKAQVELARANVHFSDVTLGRFKDAPKGLVSDLERDEKDADFQTSQAKLTAAQSDLNSAQAEVERINAMLSFRKVAAPFSGIITQRRVDIGDLVTAGSTANTTPLFVLRQTDNIRVFVDVPEALAPEIHDGELAAATSNEYPGREFTGKVARTSRAINEESKTLKVEVDIPNKDFVLLPGMYVKVNFQIRNEQPGLVIPASAIAFRTGGPQVAVVAGDGKVTFRDVDIARDLGDSIELSKGVSADEQVALNISSQVATGDIVKFNEVHEAGVAAAPAPLPAAISANIPAKADKP